MTRRPRRAEAQLDELYASIPRMNCTGQCARRACDSIGMAPIERDRIHRRHGKRLPLVGLFDPGVCPALDDGDRCTVYENRPLVCRTYGQVPSMPCPHGCVPPEQMMSERDGLMAVARTFELSGDHRGAAFYRQRAEQRQQEFDAEQAR